MRTIVINTIFARKYEIILEKDKKIQIFLDNFIKVYLYKFL